MERCSTECVVQQSHFWAVIHVVVLGLNPGLEVVVSFNGGLRNLSSVNDLAVAGKLECIESFRSGFFYLLSDSFCF